VQLVGAEIAQGWGQVGTGASVCWAPVGSPQDQD
jgi:hypothetical protein